MNNKYLFLTVLESGKSNIKAPEDLVSGDDLLLGCPLFAVSSHDGKAQGSFGGVSIIKALIPFMRAPSS